MRYLSVPVCLGSVSLMLPTYVQWKNVFILEHNNICLCDVCVIAYVGVYVHTRECTPVYVRVLLHSATLTHLGILVHPI